jgi:hypothetical protein
MKNESKPGPVHKTPADLCKALSSEATTQAAWKDLTPLARNEWICWVISAKQGTTRGRRIQRGRGAPGGQTPPLLLARLSASPTQCKEVVWETGALTTTADEALCAEQMRRRIATQNTHRQATALRSIATSANCSFGAHSAARGSNHRPLRTKDRSRPTRDIFLPGIRPCSGNRRTDPTVALAGRRADVRVVRAKRP